MSSENNKEKPNWRKLVSFFERNWYLLFVVVIAVMVGYYWILKRVITDSATQGQFGDSFGAITSLFTALAFAGLIVTLFMQREELKAQREVLTLQKEELEQTRMVFIEQSSIMRKQQFEATFFQLIENHRKCLEVITIPADLITALYFLTREDEAIGHSKDAPKGYDALNKLNTMIDAFIREYSIAVEAERVTEPSIIRNSPLEQVCNVLNKLQILESVQYILEFTKRGEFSEYEEVLWTSLSNPEKNLIGLYYTLENLESPSSYERFILKAKAYIEARQSPKVIKFIKAAPIPKIGLKAISFQANLERHPGLIRDCGFVFENRSKSKITLNIHEYSTEISQQGKYNLGFGKQTLGTGETATLNLANLWNYRLDEEFLAEASRSSNASLQVTIPVYATIESRQYIFELHVQMNFRNAGSEGLLPTTVLLRRFHGYNW